MPMLNKCLMLYLNAIRCLRNAEVKKQLLFREGQLCGCHFCCWCCRSLQLFWHGGTSGRTRAL